MLSHSGRVDWPRLSEFALTGCLERHRGIIESRFQQKVVWRSRFKTRIAGSLRQQHQTGFYTSQNRTITSIKVKGNVSLLILLPPQEK
jgi:hypothetical protein